MTGRTERRGEGGLEEGGDIKEKGIHVVKTRLHDKSGEERVEGVVKNEWCILQGCAHFTNIAYLRAIITYDVLKYDSNLEML